MVETAGPQQEQPLPRVYLTEDWKIVYVVLLYAYNMPLFGDIMRVGTPVTVLLEVFEAANKYHITALRVLCSTLLRSVHFRTSSQGSTQQAYCSLFSLSVSDMDDKEALLVFTRASLVNDEDLARIVVEKAAELPLQNISMDTLRELPIGALHHLVSTSPLRECEKCFNNQLSQLDMHTRTTCQHCSRGFQSMVLRRSSIHLSSGDTDRSETSLPASIGQSASQLPASANIYRSKSVMGTCDRSIVRI
jgi:hypothetical protein